MNTLWQVPVVVATLLTWLSTPPDTIAQAAEREAVRRVLMGKATVLYTNLDPPAYEGTVVAIPDLVTGPAPAGTGVAEAPVAPVEVDDPAAWSRQAASIRGRIAEQEQRGTELSSQISMLMNEVVARDDPFQQAELRDRLQGAWAEFDQVQDAILAGRQQLERLQDAARRAGVSMDWLQ